MDIAMKTHRQTPPEDREFSPLEGISVDDLQRYKGQFVAIDERAGGIIGNAETIEALYRLMAERDPDAVFSVLPVDDISSMTPEIYKQLTERGDQIEAE